MSTLTLEQVREKIKRNFPDQARSAKQKLLEWNRATATTILSGCGTYMIYKQEDPTNPGIWGYSVSLCPTPTSEARHLSGPFLLPKDARQAAQDHANGIPLQATLG